MFAQQSYFKIALTREISFIVIINFLIICYFIAKYTISLWKFHHAQLLWLPGTDNENYVTMKISRSMFNWLK